MLPHRTCTVEQLAALHRFPHSLSCSVIKLVCRQQKCKPNIFSFSLTSFLAGSMLNLSHAQIHALARNSANSHLHNQVSNHGTIFSAKRKIKIIIIISQNPRNIPLFLKSLPQQLLYSAIAQAPLLCRMRICAHNF
jgi:hypothetical protein